MKALFALFPRILPTIKSALRTLWRWVRPGPVAIGGAASGLIIVSSLIYLVMVIRSVEGPLLPAIIVGLGMLLLGGLLLFLGQGLAQVIHWLAAIPWRYRWALLGGSAVLVICFMGLKTEGLLATLALLIITSSLIGAGIASLTRTRWPGLTTSKRIVSVAGLVIGAAVLGAALAWYGLWRGDPAQAVINAAKTSGAPRTQVTLPNPGQPGPYAVKTLTYGAGTDRYRPEFAAGAALKTQPVDGTKLLKGSWAGTSGSATSDLRTLYWGFGPDKLPLNGRVWYPDGGANPGPFPLVLIVHGNHNASDFSDPGYAYLGELLASRGFILVSVDENFINGGATNLFESIKNENDARGWLLLEHLRTWLAWNAEPGNPFFGMVDTQNLAVMGHSRGGEAAVVAALFNRLAYYPDDATLAFHYNYNIRAVVGIAPIDGQYAPTWRNISLANVNYFVMQGSHDSDLTSFSGLRLYERVKFDPGTDGFKAALYVYRANHGQFNTIWGDDDRGRLATGFLDRAALLPGEDQRQVAEVYISAFLEATLHNQRAYLPLFEDARAAGAGWLPDTVYINRFDPAGDQLVAGFDEDPDLVSATLPGAQLAGTNLATWREQRINTRWGGGESNGVYLGWNGEKPADYALTLPDRLKLGAHPALVFNLADALEDPKPGEGKQAAGPGEAGPAESVEDKPSAPEPAKADQKSNQRQPQDLTILLEDAAGQQAALPLSQYQPVQPQLPAQLTKHALFQASAPSEAVLQSYVLPLADFVRANPAFDPQRLRMVRFVFDRTPRGSVVLDAVGFRDLK